MQYYIFELDKPSQELYMIVRLFGKYINKQLSIGLKCTPDFAQQVMENVIIYDINNTGNCRNGIGTFFMNWEHHI